MTKSFPIIVIIALTSGLLGQFIWKMIYFPEPILPVIFELIFFTTLAGIGIWMISRLEKK